MSAELAPLISPDCFDFSEGVLWLSHCKDGPLPRVSVQTMQMLLRTESRPWELRWQDDFLDVQQRLREAAARLLDVAAHDISLVTCTSTGLEAIAFGYPWQAGDEVVIAAEEFPSNRLPWLALRERGVICTEVPLWPDKTLPDADIAPEQRLLDAITPRTRMVAVSWIRFQDGIRLDLADLGEVCRARGVHLVVDGIQGAGTAVPDLTGVSAFVSGGHKGLLGAQGQGVLWTDPVFRRRLLPLGTWLSAPASFSQGGVQTVGGDLWASDGRRLEAGSPSILNCGILAASIELLLSVGGSAALQNHIARLQGFLLRELARHPAWLAESGRLTALLDDGRLGSTLSFALDQARIDALLKRGLALGIYASTRDGYLRVALHGWHGSRDVTRCIDWLVDQA
ncbi:aminotransferase class V-fold PLP-dependent enzyme [Dyella sp.]|uniref:aminotransferase class V-fold PLP-dependent enzyme n=1 Tax=Dyella sp. TaxID=1869338 RepID=UPI002ED1A183